MARQHCGASGQPTNISLMAHIYSWNHTRGEKNKTSRALHLCYVSSSASPLWEYLHVSSTSKAYSPIETTVHGRRRERNSPSQPDTTIGQLPQRRAYAAAIVPVNPCAGIGRWAGVNRLLVAICQLTLGRRESLRHVGPFLQLSCALGKYIRAEMLEAVARDRV